MSLRHIALRSVTAAGFITLYCETNGNTLFDVYLSFCNLMYSSLFHSVPLITEKGAHTSGNKLISLLHTNLLNRMCTSSPIQTAAVVFK